jgi:hypothetical protein
LAPGQKYLLLITVQGATAAAPVAASTAHPNIPEPPKGQTIDPALVNLVVTTSSGDAPLVLPDSSGDCSEGWQLSGNQVVLREGTCSRVRTDGAPLQLLFGCESGNVPVPK